MRSTLKIILIGFLSGILGAYSYQALLAPAAVNQAGTGTDNGAAEVPFQNQLAGYTAAEMEQQPITPADLATDFTVASQASTESVVYIKTTTGNEYGRRSWMDLLFGGGGGKSVSTGSGVIYTADGYIITNNHVINGADDIEVIHGKNSYAANVVGTDPSTDLAVLKVAAKDLPNITIGSSAEVKVGEWVLAVGNPFNLTSTVTAGIVSAKGRQINILQGRFPLESFIQTDAAINPGNSGGALVNTKGQLVGINTAILSQTGSYAGYGFAVPVDIARKVADDMINYGEVQKAFIGADVIDIDAEVAERLELNSVKGVVVSYVRPEGPAYEVGIRQGDVITAIDGTPVDSRSQFDEMLGYHSPGQKVQLTYSQQGKANTASLTLTNREGTTEILMKELYSAESLGVVFEDVPQVEKDRLKIESGVRVSRIKNGFFKRLGIPEGFIITSINNNAIESPEMLTRIIERIRGRVIIRGINEEGVRGYYTFYF